VSDKEVYIGRFARFWPIIAIEMVVGREFAQKCHPEEGINAFL
jgi:hypothetical protein